MQTLNNKKHRNPNEISKKGMHTTLIGIIINALLAIIKGLGGIFGNSYALIADAIESISDIITSGLLWFSLRWSTKPPDKNHPYGHGKAEALVAIGIAIALVATAILIGINSIDNIKQPHKSPAPYTLVILLVVVLIKELLYRFVIKTGDKINSGAIKADAFHHRSDAITSIAAFIGISIALVGGKGFEVADDYAALIAAIFILYNAYKIGRPAIGELLDEQLQPEIQQKIILLTNQILGVEKVEQCRTRKMGSAYHIDLHLWVKGSLSVNDGHQIAHHVKDHLISNIPQIIDVHIHVEPNE